MVQLLIVVDSHIQLTFNNMKKALILISLLFALGLASCSDPLVSTRFVNPVESTTTTTNDTTPTSGSDITIGDGSSNITPSTNNITTKDGSTIIPTTNNTTSSQSGENTTSTSSDGIEWDPTIIWP